MSIANMEKVSIHLMMKLLKDVESVVKLVERRTPYEMICGSYPKMLRPTLFKPILVVVS